jgi:DNA modification methylase
MIIQGDCVTVLRERFTAESVQCCVTSPPYWGLRDYGVEGQLGLEKTPEEYVSKMVEVFREVKRVLKKDGTLWLNLGDSYAGSGKGIGSDHGKAVFTDGEIVKTKWNESGLKPKDLVGIPWRVAFALQADGWYLRSDIIWHKPNPMPESVTDRPTKAHEYLFLLSKAERYYYNAGSIAEKSIIGILDGGTNPYNLITQTGGRDSQNLGGSDGTRNKRSVWTVATQPYSEAHFATFPPKLIEPCILAGCPSGGLVLDPFAGSGTTLQVAQQLGRRGVGIELNPAYIELAEQRTAQAGLPL